MNWKPDVNIKFAVLWQKIRRRLDRDFLIFIFFFLLSGIFWLLNQLNREAFGDISYPVRYTNLPGKKMLANEVPNKLFLKVKAPGYTLLKYKMSPKFIPFNIDLSTFYLHQKNGDDGSYFMLSRELISRMNRRLSEGLNVLEIQPDTLYFRFDSVFTRKIPVKPAVNFTFAQQYWLVKPVYTNPDSVMVSGPGVLLDTLQAINTVPLNFKNLQNTVVETVELESHARLNYSVKNVQLTIPVEQFTEATLKVPIETIHVPDSVVLKTFPLQVSLTCITGLDNYEKISPHIFRVVVDYNQINQHTGEKLSVELALKPDFVRSVRINPGSVEFVIEKK